MNNTAAKKGMTLLEVCVVIAVSAVLFVNMISFAGYIRAQLLRYNGITKNLRDAQTMSEVIRAEFRKSDVPECSVSAVCDGGKWQSYAEGTLKNDMIKSVVFQTRADVENPTADTAGAVTVCTVTFYLQSKTEGSPTSTYTFALVRRTTY